MKLVKTITGQEVPRSSCRKIDGEYYKIGDPSIQYSGDVYFINNKYYKENTGYIVFDHSIMQYVIKNSSLIEGVVQITNNQVELGFMSEITEGLNIEYAGKVYYLRNEEITLNSIFVYDPIKLLFVDRRTIPVKRLYSLPTIKSSIKNSLDYSITKNTIAKKTLSLKEVTPGVLAELTSYFTKELTFGLEFETTKGMVPGYICNQNGLVPLRDGSINGLEYVTIPLQGSKGVQHLINNVKALDKFTELDESCSLHVHIGNIPRTKEFIMALFKLLIILQDEFYSLFPLYKRYNLGIKRKKYTAEYNAVNYLTSFHKDLNDTDNLNGAFSSLFIELSGGYNFAEYKYDLNNISYHPADSAGNSKWYIKSRYRWVNFIPLIFGNKETVEFRIHTPTTDIIKISYYLSLLGAVVNYAKVNSKTILRSGYGYNSNLYDIINTQIQDDTKFFSDNNKKLYYEYFMDYLERRREFYTPVHTTVDLNAPESKLQYSIPKFLMYNKSEKRIKQIDDYYKNNSLGLLDGIMYDSSDISISNISENMWTSLYSSSLENNEEDIDEETEFNED